MSLCILEGHISVPFFYLGMNICTCALLQTCHCLNVRTREFPSAVENASSWNQGSNLNHVDSTRKGNYEVCTEDFELRAHMTFLKVPIYAPVFLRNTLLVLILCSIYSCLFEGTNICPSAFLRDTFFPYFFLETNIIMCPAWNLQLSQLCLFQIRTNICPCNRLPVISIYTSIPLFDWEAHVLLFYLMTNTRVFCSNVLMLWPKNLSIVSKLEINNIWNRSTYWVFSSAWGQMHLPWRMLRLGTMVPTEIMRIRLERATYAPCTEDLDLRVHMAILKVPIYAPAFPRNILLGLILWKRIFVPFGRY